MHPKSMNLAKLTACGLWICYAALAAPCGAEETPDNEASAAVDYAQVAEIFTMYCTACHNGDDAESGLVLESYEQLLQGGERGVAIVAGKSADSRLLLVLEGKAEPLMPPEGNDPPSADEIALLKAWVDAGAKGPEGKVPDPTELVVPKIEPRGTPRQALNAAAFSPDGKLLALAGYREVRLLNAANRATVRTLSDHAGNVNGVSFSADGKWLIAAAGEPGLFGEVSIWNVADGQLVRTIRGHRDALFDAALSPDGTVLATAGYDSAIELWDPHTGESLRTLRGHNGAVYDLDFRSDGRVLASVSADRTVKLWDVADGRRLDTLAESLKELYAVALNHDGTRVAAGGVDNRVRVWKIGPDAAAGTNRLLYARFAHEGAIIALGYSADGGSLVSTAEDRTVKVWDAEAMTARFALEAQSDWPTALAVAPDSAAFVVGRLDGTYELHATADGLVVPPPAPTLARLAPRGVQRGASTRVQLIGENLLNVREIRAGDNRLSVQVLDEGQHDAGHAWAEVTPAADLTPGAYQLTVHTAGGDSGELVVYVDHLPQWTEQQFDTAASPKSTPYGVWGDLETAGDVDRYEFDAAAGETIVMDVSAARIGSKANIVLTLHDPQGRVVAGSNDFDGQADPLVAYTATSAGRYRVHVRDLLAAGSEDHFYQLTVGALAYVTGCYPLSVPPDSETPVQLVGYNIPPSVTVEVKSGKRGEVDVPVDAERFRSRRALKVVVGELPEVLEIEPNNLSDVAQSVPVPVTVGGRIYASGDSETATAGDADFFRFESTAGAQWIIESDAARRGSPLDTKIEVLHEDGRPVTRMLLEAVRDSNIEFRGTDSNGSGFRVKNWEEMELNEYLYVGGEVCRLFRMPQGPDSDMIFYTSSGKRRSYFDTSSTSHALYDPCYIVRPHPVGTQLVPNGLPVFELHYANDDDGRRRLGSDSRLFFTAPADGAYLVRVSDVRGAAGERFAYRLSIREPRPDFRVSLNANNPAIPAGSGQRFTVNVQRIDGFEDEVQVDITGLPPGFSVSSPIVIQAGHDAAQGVINAAADAPRPTADNESFTQVTATAMIDGQTVQKEVKNLGKISLAEKPQLLVYLEPDAQPAETGGRPFELSIAPGASVTARLRVERNGFDGRIQFDLDNLPHGVIVDNIGLNGVLIREGETTRQIVLTAADWVPPTTRPLHAVAQTAGNQASLPALLHVRPPGELASADAKE